MARDNSTLPLTEAGFYQALKYYYPFHIQGDFFFYGCRREIQGGMSGAILLILQCILNDRSPISILLDFDNNRKL